ncbi:hypothetical protein [Streptomyces sp. NPDC047990]|uniref:hypothetical protein n=1 Tax=Streptomyces sp. NPDC047990 TaxID=3365496 RepID=UPI003720745A
MRVRVKKKAVAYWNYAVQTFEPGEELEGDVARVLADSAPSGTVEVLEDDPEPEPAPEPDPAGDGQGEGEVPEELDIDGTAKEVLAWVDGDQDRAQVALDAEQAKDSPRSTLVKTLQKIADGDE